MDGKEGNRSENESTICTYENSGSLEVKQEGKETWLGPDDFPNLVEKEDPLSLLTPVRLGNTYAVVAASKLREETAASGEKSGKSYRGEKETRSPPLQRKERSRRSWGTSQKQHLDFAHEFFMQLAPHAPTLKATTQVAGRGMEGEEWQLQGKKRGRKRELNLLPPPTTQNLKNNRSFTHPDVSKHLMNGFGEFGPNSNNENGDGDLRVLSLFSSPRPKEGREKRRRGRKEKSPPAGLAAPRTKRKVTKHRMRQMKMFTTFYSIHMRKHIKNQYKNARINETSALSGYESVDIGGKFYVPLKLEGKACRSFLDTGSDISIVPRSLINDLGIQLEHVVPPIALKSYSNHSIKAKCAAWLNVAIGDYFRNRHLFLVTEENSNLVVLSKHFLREFKVGLYWNEGECFLDLPKTDLILKKKKGEKIKKYKDFKSRRRPSPSSPTPHGASSPAPRWPPAGERERIRISFEASTYNIANTDSINIQPNRKRLIAVDLEGFVGKKLPKKLVITPQVGVRLPIVFSPSLSPRCRCRKNCPRFVAEITNYSSEIIKIKPGKLKGNAEVYIEPANMVIKAADALQKIKTGACSTKSNIFRGFCGKHDVTAEIFTLTLDEKEKGAFDIKPGEEPLFEASLPFATIDPATGFPSDPQHFKSAQEAINWDEIAPENIKHIKHIFLERNPSVISKGFFDSGNASARGLGRARVVTSGPPAQGKAMYPLSATKKLGLLKILRGMNAVGWISRVVSAHGSPVFVIPRKQGDIGRLLINLINVNQVCVNTPVALLSSPLQKIQTLADAKLFSVMDLRQAYMSIELDEESKGKFCLNTCAGQFQMNRLAQGSSLAPSLFCSFLEKALYDSPITGCLENYNLGTIFPEERKNPYANLANFLCLHLDDVILFSPDMGNPEATREFHAQILARVVDHLDRYSFKISFHKSSFFKESLDVLGMRIEGGKIIPDPKRYDDIKKFPFPSSRNQMLGFTSLVGTIRHAMSLQSHEELAKLYDLTSIKTEYRPTESHKKAFENLKKELGSEPLITYIPTNKPKLLFTDASEKLIGAALFEIDFPDKILTREANSGEEGRNFSVYDRLGSKVYKYCTSGEIQLSKTHIPGDGNCFIHSVIDQLRIYKFRNKLPEHVNDFRNLICTFLLAHKTLEEESREILAATSNLGWRKYIEYLGTPGEPTDSLNIFVRGTADFLGRDIHIITDVISQKEPIIVKSKLKTADLPPLFLGYLSPTEANGIGHYVSLLVRKENPLSGSPFTSFSTEKSWRDLSQEELFAQVRKLWNKNEAQKPGLRALGYISRTIHEEGAADPIHIKELRALLEAVHQFREMIAHAPATIVCIDSRALWCLLSNALHQSVHKLQRWSISLKEKYPNLLFYLVRSGENLADFFSRQFNPKDCALERLRLRPTFKTPVVELEKKGLLTVEEAGEIVNSNEQYLEHCAKPTEKAKKEAEINSLTHDRLSQLLLPLKELQNRLSPAKVIAKQKEELPDEYRIALGVPLGRQPADVKFSLLNGILAVQGDKKEMPKIYIPPSLEGTVIAYHHLQSGHRLGRQGLFLTLANNYYFPRLRHKTQSFSDLCLNCTLIHGIKTRKQTLGRTLVSKQPLEILYTDIVNLGSKTNKTTADYLVIVCSFSKFVQIYPLPSLTDAAVIKCFKTFFSHMGIVTNYIIADNGTQFRSKKFLSLAAALGIKVVYSSAWNSQARGQVEVFNYLIKKLIAALVMNKSTYAFRDELFLINAIMNNTINLTTKSAPAELIFGRPTLANNGIGLQLKPPVLSSSLINSSLATDIKTMREALERLWKTTTFHLEKVREKQEAKYNKFAKDKKFQVGDLVFLLDRRLPTAATSKKLAPPLQKSPYVVDHVYSKVLDVTRLLDKFSTRVSKNDVKPIKSMSPSDPLFLSLPESVRNEIGRPLTTEALKELALTDTLPVLLREDFYRYGKTTSGVETRAQRQKRELEEAELARAFDDPVGGDDADAWAWLDDDDDEIESKNVSFAPT